MDPHQTSSALDLARVEHIVTQFFAKSLHVILESRCVSSHIRNKNNNISTTQNSVREASDKDRWFNLALRDCSLPVLNNGVQYSRQMVVDLVLLQYPPGRITDSRLRTKDEISSCRKVVERWVVMYEGRRKGRGDDSLKKGSSRTLEGFYKKCVLMLRSLYLMLRLLPAYKVYRELKEFNKPCEVGLVYHVSAFAEPFDGEVEAEMRRYVFEPVESFSGRLCLSVMHFPALEDLRIRPPINQIVSNLIPDYFGAESVHHVSGALLVRDIGNVIAGSKASGSGTKPSLHPKSEFHLATQAQPPINLPVNASIREIAADGVKTQHAAKCLCSNALSTSVSPSPLTRMGFCPLHYFSQTEVNKCQNPEENGDPLPAEFSNNAVLGSLVNEFQTAAPLRLSSTLRSNTANVPATAEVLASNPLVKTALDAIQELQEHIDMKNTILEKTPH